MIHLATGLAVRDERVLLVASRYPNHPDPLWNLPGGRQQPGELLEETVVREVFEETRLRVEVRELAYVSESYDGATHFLNVTFGVALRASSFDSLPLAQDCEARASFDFARYARSAQDDIESDDRGDDSESDDRGDDGESRDHVVAVEWVPIDELAERIVVGVVREPLLQYLRGALPGRYAGYHDAGITIEWPADSR